MSKLKPFPDDYVVTPAMLSYGRRADCPLTPRQYQVLVGISLGLQYHETAEVLGVSKDNVKSMARFVMDYLGARNMPHAVMLAFHEDILRV